MTASRHELVPTRPYRLDLTVGALRRVATNVVDIYSEDGDYLRALDVGGHVAVVRARQVDPGRVAVQVFSERAEQSEVTTLARSMLGIDRDTSAFVDAARKIPWLAPLAARLGGLKPPRYPSLWEAFVNAVVFQQVSLQSASAITRRLVVALGEKVEIEERFLVVFPDEDRFLRAPSATLRGAGLSANKLRALTHAAEAVRSGEFTHLDDLTSPDAARELQRIPGVGPWTAAVILLRGLGRLDVFPPGDSGVSANLRRLIGAPSDVSAVLEQLGEVRGLLYFYLLLARLDHQGRIGEASVPWGGDGGTRRPSVRFDV